MKMALWQTKPRHTITEALEALKNATAQATENGAELLVTPEMFIGGYNIGEAQVRRHAMQSDSVISKLHGITITYKPAVIVGMANNFDQSPTNSCIAINAAGKILGKYDKTHLFEDVDHQQFIAGTQLSKIVTLNGWRIGLAICYDVEFPEVVRALALNGTDLVVIPTANMTPFDSVATRLVPARAEENAVYMAYCNYVGREGEFSYNGLSCICGPDGNDITRGDAQNEALLYADLDHTILAAARRTQTHLRDRRQDLY